MNDTRETIIKPGDYEEVPAKNELGHDVPPDKRPAPRFKKRDILISAYAPEQEFKLYGESRWDREFCGWLVHLGSIGVHESNFILACEKDLWDPHPNVLWSWWTKKKELQ